MGKDAVARATRHESMIETFSGTSRLRLRSSGLSARGSQRWSTLRPLEIELSEFGPVQQHDLPLGLADEAQYALVVKHRQRARHRLQCQPEIVGDVAAAHRQRDHA